MADGRYDVIVVGAGVLGLSVARELLRREISVLVLEKEYDVGRGASGRNSGVVHPGFAVAPGSLKARLNVEGSRALPTLCEELSVPFRRVGTLVVAFDETDVPALEEMRDRGRANGLTGLKIVDGVRLRELEPSVGGVAALYSPDGAIIEPLLLVFRLCDNVVANGGEVVTSAEVLGVERGADGWLVSTARAEYAACVVVNACGVGAPAFSRMAGVGEFGSYPCRGEYLVLDKRACGVPGRMVYPVPPKTGGLGVHFTPTISGNTLIGPSAEYVEDGEDYATTGDVLARLVAEASALCPTFDVRDVITTFAGVRSKISKGAYGETDFVVEASSTAEGFVNLVGIESPGLSASPAIARMAAGIVVGQLQDPPVRERFDPTEEDAPRFVDLSEERRVSLAEADLGYRRLVCRCEGVTEAEVLSSLENPVGARSLMAVRARCRAGSGRCQGSFCTPRIVGILRDRYGLTPEGILMRGESSQVAVGGAKVLWR